MYGQVRYRHFAPVASTDSPAGPRMHFAIHRSALEALAATSSQGRDMANDVIVRNIPRGSADIVGGVANCSGLDPHSQVLVGRISVVLGLSLQGVGHARNGGHRALLQRGREARYGGV